MKIHILLPEIFHFVTFLRLLSKIKKKTENVFWFEEKIGRHFNKCSTLLAFLFTSQSIVEVVIDDGGYYIEHFPLFLLATYILNVNNFIKLSITCNTKLLLEWENVKNRYFHLLKLFLCFFPGKIMNSIGKTVTQI